jgi:release factor glutamine methyltransferase
MTTKSTPDRRNDPLDVHEPMMTKSTPSSSKSRSSEQAVQKAWTVRSVLQWTTDFFTEHDLASARLDAEVLLAHVLEQDRLALYLHYEDTVPAAALQAYRGLIRRRVNREPIAYITGRREFYSIPLAVEPSVLIPRPETEHLVEYVVEHVQDHRGSAEQGAPKILEIGTGSGNLCIALAKTLPQAQIVSLDISFSAISVARKNRREHPDCSDRIRFLQGDLLGGLHPERARFHLIVSNPPYVPTESWNDLPPDVRDYEPRIALDGGHRGTEILHRILSHAARHLLPDGALVLEIGEDQAEALTSAADETGHYRRSRVLKDYAGKPRVFVAVT